MSNNEGVHRTHCCIVHGCKYGDEDCPVETGKILQDYICETCSEVEGWSVLKQVKERVTESMDTATPLVTIEDYNRRFWNWLEECYKPPDEKPQVIDNSAAVLQVLRSKENHILAQIGEIAAEVDSFNQTIKDVQEQRNKIIEDSIIGVLAEHSWDLSILVGGGTTFVFEGGNIKEDDRPRPLLQELLEYDGKTSVWHRFEKYGFTIDCTDSGDIDITIDNATTSVEEFVNQTAIVVNHKKALGQVDAVYASANRLLKSADELKAVLKNISPSIDNG